MDNAVSFASFNTDIVTAGTESNVVFNCIAPQRQQPAEATVRVGEVVAGINHSFEDHVVVGKVAVHDIREEGHKGGYDPVVLNRLAHGEDVVGVVLLRDDLAVKGIIIAKREEQQVAGPSAGVPVEELVRDNAAVLFSDGGYRWNCLSAQDRANRLFGHRVG